MRGGGDIKMTKNNTERGNKVLITLRVDRGVLDRLKDMSIDELDRSKLIRLAIARFIGERATA
jgi:hypothetical protein